MEIDITSFMTDADPYEFSGSIAERGDDAGPETWHNALEQAKGAPLLITPDQLGAMLQWAKETGAWDAEERAAWSPDEINALFIQLISGDMRAAGMDQGDLEDFDWQEYEMQSSAGQISGNIYRGDVEGSDGFGRFFYYLGS